MCGFFYASDGGGEELIRIAFNRELELFDEVERRVAGFSAASRSG